MHSGLGNNEKDIGPYSERRFKFKPGLNEVKPGLNHI